MNQHSKTASLAGLTGSVVMKVVGTSTYQIRPEIATSFDYASTKLAMTRRLHIETARVVCRLAGIGGTQ